MKYKVTREHLQKVKVILISYVKNKDVVFNILKIKSKKPDLKKKKAKNRPTLIRKKKRKRKLPNYLFFKKQPPRREN